MKSEENPYKSIVWTRNNDLSCKEHDNRSRFWPLLLDRQTDRFTDKMPNARLKKEPSLAFIIIIVVVR